MKLPPWWPAALVLVLVVTAGFVVPLVLYLAAW